MQSQESGYESQQQVTPERAVNRDPREQASPYTEGAHVDERERTYEEGYTGQYAQDSWFQEGEKLHPQAPRQRNASSVFVFIGILCLALIASNVLGLLSGWLIWGGVLLLIGIGAYLAILNWRVITLPMPTESFMIQEHARLDINNVLGRVTIRQGEDNVVTVKATKKASGIGMTLDSMRIDYQQQGDSITMKSAADSSFFQFGWRSFELEITVPKGCDVQMKTGSGRVEARGFKGDIRLRTGSGGIEIAELEGRIDARTGSGSVNADQIKGDLLLKTGSGHIMAQELNGSAELNTGSGSITVMQSNLTRRTTIKTGSGPITVTQSPLAGSALFKTGSGSVTYSGGLDPLGTYELRTGSGSVSMTLPSQSALTLNASTSSGKVINAFEHMPVDGPRAQVRVKTGSGSITVAKV
ncbi:hypothetical protein KSC_042750 [Ktedonobacter sp. SOSP1-52]|uniref:DUF4097 family beta strand repeat-containing protein n=1 Tax=Ktedonobacter sp. SOSP1-52 TaxID=2778366 RepID=UPI0019150B50|nr:DUF4097 family beta strand repeat-containing protein [Ktedonobacter sp. SOSP1-52]GHO65383.1 hypothetical protein KSC_042750 [Ktedonobacter sp. SOSP1-52]